MFTHKPHERIHFKELELMVLHQWGERGYLNPNPEAGRVQDQIHLGNMVMDLILVAENMGFDLTDCLNVAYKARVGADGQTDRDTVSPS